MGTTVQIPKIHKIPPDVDFWSLKVMNPVDNAEQYYPHDNFVGNCLCGEYKNSALPLVGHMPESIL